MFSGIRVIAAAGLLALAVASRPLALSTQQATAESGLPSFAEPAISPDGREIAFVSGGDIWTVPATGGDARLLVSHAANESRPQWAPDGRRLAFVSTRTGAGDVYVLALDTGEVSRLTWDDAGEVLDGWSADGEWVYFSSASRDVAGMSDVFRVRATGGMPMPVSNDRYVSEFFSAPGASGFSPPVRFPARSTPDGRSRGRPTTGGWRTSARPAACSRTRRSWPRQAGRAVRSPILPTSPATRWRGVPTARS